MWEILVIAGRTICFYASCVRWAAAGTLERANAWFWPIGVPVVAFVGWWFGLGTLMIPDHLEGFLTFMVVTVAVSWFIFFVIRFIGAPGRLYGDAQDKIKSLIEQSRPKLNVYLDTRNAGVQTVLTEIRTLPPQPGPTEKWVQFVVESATEAPLEACEARVIEIARLKDDGSIALQLIQEAVSCNWSQISGEAINIPPHVPQAANLISLSDETGTPTLYPRYNHVKVFLQNEIQKLGKYRIRTVVSAKKTTSLKKSFMLEWGGSFAAVKLSVMEDEWDT